MTDNMLTCKLGGPYFCGLASKAPGTLSNIFFNTIDPTSQLILQPFRRFNYVTAHSPTLPLLHLRHRLFTYATWRAAHDL